MEVLRRVTSLLTSGRSANVTLTIQRVVDAFASLVDDPIGLEQAASCVDKIFSERGAFEKKLVLYCIDSIAKHLGPLFSRSFEPRIVSYFGDVQAYLDANPGPTSESDRQTLQKIVSYWSYLRSFSAAAINEIMSQPANLNNFIHFTEYKDPDRICHLNIYINQLDKRVEVNAALYETIVELIVGRDVCPDVLDFIVEKIRVSSESRLLSIFYIFDSLLLRHTVTFQKPIRDRLVPNLRVFYDRIKATPASQQFQGLLSRWDKYYSSEDIVTFFSVLKPIPQPPPSYPPILPSLAVRPLPPMARPPFYAPYAPPAPSYYPQYVQAQSVVMSRPAPLPPPPMRQPPPGRMAEALHRLLEASIDYIPNQYLFVGRPLYRIASILESLKTGAALPPRVYELSMDQSFRLNQQDLTYRNQKCIDVLYKRAIKDSMKCDTCGLRFDTETEYQEIHIPYHFHLRQLDKARLVRNFYSSSTNFDQLIFSDMLDTDVHPTEEAGEAGVEASHYIPMSTIAEPNPICLSCGGDFQSEWFNGAYAYKACKLVRGKLYHLDCDVSGEEDGAEEVGMLLEAPGAEPDGPPIKRLRAE